MGSLINPSTSNEMVEILKNQVYKDIIPKYLPDNVKVAHKTGWISGVRHDSGIVFLENGKKYVLILLSKNLDDDIEGAEFLAKISLEITLADVLSPVIKENSEIQSPFFSFATSTLFSIVIDASQSTTNARFSNSLFLLTSFKGFLFLCLIISPNLIMFLNSNGRNIKK